MMLIARITVRRSARINLGNYESAEASASITADLTPGDTVTDTFRQLWSLAQHQVADQTDLIRRGDKRMPIVGLSDDLAQFPKIGDIRKGGPKGEKRPGADLDYFRVTFTGESAASSEKLFVEHYGEQPRALHVTLPYNQLDRVFEAWQEKYEGSKLVHRCDGRIVHYPADLAGTECQLKDLEDPRQRCQPRGRLYVILPVLGRLGYLTVHTSSKHDIRNITRQLRAIQSFTKRLTGIPLILRRVERSITTPVVKNGKRRSYKKWLLEIEVNPAWVQEHLDTIHNIPMLEEGEDTPLLADGVVNEETGEVITHWYDGLAPDGTPTRTAFEAWVQKMGLSLNQAYGILNVTDMHDFTGTKAEAVAMIKTAVTPKPADTSPSPDDEEYFIF